MRRSRALIVAGCGSACGTLRAGRCRESAAWSGPLCPTVRHAWRARPTPRRSGQSRFTSQARQGQLRKPCMARRRVSREEESRMMGQAVPQTKGVAVELLATVDLGPEIEGMEGRQLRMRMVTIEPGESSARFTTTRADRAPSTCSRERSPTIGMESPRTTARVSAGPRTATPSTGSRTGEGSAVEISVDVVRSE